MPTLIMLVGVSGSGKTTFTEKKKDFLVFSSDKIRKECFGDESDQTHNQKVFEILHKGIKDALKTGNTCIYDATNLNRKRRIGFLKSLNGISCIKKCVIFCTPIETCLDRDSTRRRTVGEGVIKKQISQFQLPLEYEGWDEIEFYFGDITKQKTLFDYIPKDKVPHDCPPWHLEDIQTHLYKTAIEMAKRTDREEMILSARYHDIGKFYTKTFYNRAKNEKSDRAHYYSHENWGAYLFMTSYEFRTKIKVRQALPLIALHMELNLKNSSVLKNIPESLLEDLKLLHECDKLGSERLVIE